MKLRVIKKPAEQVKKGLSCLNCSQPFRGDENFCSYCGQKNNTNPLSFGLFVNNIFSGMFNYDSRFWKTFVPLLTMPGKVSRLYIDGKRACFVNPFQLYFNVSIIFFLFIGIVEKFSEEDPVPQYVNISNMADSIQKNPQQIDSIANMAKQELIKASQEDSTLVNLVDQIDVGAKLVKGNIEKNKKPYKYYISSKKESDIRFFHKVQDFQKYADNNDQIPTDEALSNMGYSTRSTNQFLYRQLKNANKNVKQMQEDNGKKFFTNLKSHIPITLFVFLPIFTLFLSLIYIRRNFTYMEHLVFVFHTQTVFFLLYLIFHILNLFVDIESALWVFAIIFLIYLYYALRSFYQQGRFKTIVKFIVLNSYYMFLAVIGFAIISVLTVVEG